MIHLDQITECNICCALVAYDKSIKHYEWHDMWNRKFYRINQQQRFDEESTISSDTKPTQIVSVRLDPYVVTVLREMAAEQETTVSDIIRAAIGKLLFQQIAMNEIT